MSIALNKHTFTKRMPVKHAHVSCPLVKQMHFKQRGFSLIEALIAFMIISVGMLGIASLQTISMKAGHTAVTRTAAIFSSQNILDRMRANNTQLVAYNVTDSVTDAGTDNGCNDVVGDNSSPNSVTSAAVSCAPANLAADDIFHWKQSLGVGIKGSITVTPPDAGRVLSKVEVIINWTERAVQGTNIQTANDYSVTLEM